MKKVIHYKNLPARFPTFQTLTTALALDYWNAPQWLWGVLGSFFVFLWISAIIAFGKEELVDVLETENNKPFSKVLKNFSNELEKKINEQKK